MNKSKLIPEDIQGKRSFSARDTDRRLELFATLFSGQIRKKQDDSYTASIYY